LSRTFFSGLTYRQGLKLTLNCDFRQPEESALYASQVSLSSIFSLANSQPFFIFSKDHFPNTQAGYITRSV
jgi:hypothetical protein